MSQAPTSTFIEGTPFTAEPESLAEDFAGPAHNPDAQRQASLEKLAQRQQPWRSGAQVESTLAASGRWDSYSSSDSMSHNESATRSTVVGEPSTSRTNTDSIQRPELPKRQSGLSQLRLTSTGEVKRVPAKGQGTRELEEILGLNSGNEQRQRSRGSTIGDLSIATKDIPRLPSLTDLKTVLSPKNLSFHHQQLQQSRQPSGPRRQDTLTMWTNTLLAGASAGASPISPSGPARTFRPPMRQRSRSESDLSLWITPPSHQNTIVPAALPTPLAADMFGAAPSKPSPLGQQPPYNNFDEGFDFAAWQNAIETMRQPSFSALNLAPAQSNLLQVPSPTGTDSRKRQRRGTKSEDFSALANAAFQLANVASPSNYGNNFMSMGQVDATNNAAMFWPQKPMSFSPSDGNNQFNGQASFNHNNQLSGALPPQQQALGDAYMYNTDGTNTNDPLDQLKQAAASIGHSEAAAAANFFRPVPGTSGGSAHPAVAAMYREPVLGGPNNHSPSEATSGGGTFSPSASEAAYSYAASDDGGVTSGASAFGESKTPSKTVQAAKKRRNPSSKAKFVCEICGETFTRKYNLKGHERAHRNEKPYKCSYEGCEKAFARSHDRKRHELLHSGVKKYHCEPCNRDFVRLDALQRHHRSDVGQKCVQDILEAGGLLPYDP